MESEDTDPNILGVPNGYLTILTITEDEGASGDGSVCVTFCAAVGSPDDNNWGDSDPSGCKLYYKPNYVTLEEDASYKIYIASHDAPEDNQDTWYKIISATPYTE